MNIYISSIIQKEFNAKYFIDYEMDLKPDAYWLDWYYRAEVMKSESKEKTLGKILEIWPDPIQMKKNLEFFFEWTDQLIKKIEKKSKLLTF